MTPPLTERSQGKCPICRRPTEREFRPFCSARCKDIDLSRWLSGAYAVPSRDGDDDEDGETAETAPAQRESDGEKPN
jgi:uncharacterized protein